MTKLKWAVEDAKSWLLAWVRLGLFIMLHTADDPTVGLSLPFCIRAVLEGEAPAFGKVIVPDKYENEAEWKKLLEHYASIYWTEYPRQAKMMAQRLWDRGCIEQSHTLHL